MRQFVGDKKLRKLREQTGLPIVRATVRGGTGHRVDLYLQDGTIMQRFPDGTMQPDPLKWKAEEAIHETQVYRD